MISRPSKRTEPLRLPMIPITDFSVVVLPAPFRPSSVTTSPGATRKLTPCKMWDSSYQASRSRTASTGSADADCPAAALAIFTSAMARSQVGFFHALIPGQFGIIALRQHMTAGQHRDDVGEVGDHGKIMFDHQDSMLDRKSVV